MRLSCDCSGQLPDVEPEEGFLCIVQNNVLFVGILLLHKRMLYTNPATSPNQKFALGQAQIRMGWEGNIFSSVRPIPFSCMMNHVYYA